MQAIIDKEVDKMLEDGVEPVRSAWSLPIVIIKKRDNSHHRFCIDFRKVNNVIDKDANP